MNALVHWLMAVLFVGWGLYFIFVLFRFRAGSNPQHHFIFPEHFRQVRGSTFPDQGRDRL